MPLKGGDEAIPGCLRWLVAQQAQNGSFVGLASSQAEPFVRERKHQNAFFTSLILICLQGIDGNSTIVRKGIKFLKSQQSGIGSWNYWDINSSVAQKYPFPDDLDDTACALLALSIYEPSYVDGSVLAQLAKLLIANELKPGGPYRTWLVEPSMYKDWGDTDLAVNANIGGLLAHHGVKSPALEEYAALQLSEDGLNSRYYLGEVPSLYFLSRWYRGNDLKKLVSKYLRSLDDKSDMETAMLLTAGCRLKVSHKYLEEAQRRLISHMQDGHWPAAPLYKELTIKGTLYYAGSPELTTAFVFEALQLLNVQPQIKIETKTVTNTYKEVEKSSQKLPAKLRKEYLSYAGRVVSSDPKGQITDMAGISARSFGLKTNTKAYKHLNLASLNGWIAYSIYDDFYDQEANPRELAVANHAMRQTVLSYSQALPQNQEFSLLVQKTMDIMDAANHWEVSNARAATEGSKLYYKLPNYVNYAKLAERSWGHTLAAIGPLLAAGFKIDSSEAADLQKFFHHYLIARQLNDDAHDWLEDLERGHLSAAVTMLLKSYRPAGPIDVKTDQKQLQLHFWQQTIDEVGSAIKSHLRAARKALNKSGVVDDKTFGGWLDSLEAATNQAVSGSQETKKFINAYNSNT